METISDWKSRAVENAKVASERWQDRTWKSWSLASIDIWLGLGWWWFRPFSELTTIETGLVSKEQTFRMSLPGHRIAWGKQKEYYDNGKLASEGFTWQSPYPHVPTVLSDWRYWSRDGAEISEKQYLSDMFGSEAVDEIKEYLPFSKSSSRS